MASLELDGEKLDSYLMTGLRIGIVLILASVALIPVDILLYFIQQLGAEIGFGLFEWIINFSLYIIMLIIHFTAIGYVGRKLYGWK
jgi:hypothetical protein